MQRLLGLALAVAAVAGGGASEQAERADALPDSFDWYSHQLVTRVLNQHTPKYCQSSWALSAMGALADRIKIARAAQLVAQGPDIHLAVQVLLNCAGGVAGNCSSGSPADAYRFVQDFDGVAYESCQPYQADDTRGCGGASVCQSCTAEGCFSVRDGDQRDATRLGTFTTALPKAKVADWGVVSGERAMQEEIRAHGPVVCAASAAALSEYSGGVLANDGVRAEDDAEPQYVAVVGWGQAEDATPYWRIRNSWGEFWGETGFYRSARGGNGVDASPCFWATPDSWMQSAPASDGVAVVQYDAPRAASFWRQVDLRTMIEVDDDPVEVQDTDANVFTSGVDAIDDVMHGSLTGVGFALVLGFVFGVVMSSKSATDFKHCFRAPTYGEYVPIGSDSDGEGEFEDEYYYEDEGEAGLSPTLHLEEQQESPATYH